MHIRRLMLPAIYLRIRNLLKCCQRQRQNLEHTRKMQRLQRRKRSRSAKARKGGERRSGKKERGTETRQKKSQCAVEEKLVSCRQSADSGKDIVRPNRITLRQCVGGRRSMMRRRKKRTLHGCACVCVCVCGRLGSTGGPEAGAGRKRALQLLLVSNKNWCAADETPKSLPSARRGQSRIERWEERERERGRGD